ncbi:MAG: histidinol-phosphate transaminase [Gammaproteobacteria bacterium]|nr:histidinol-phosphate transaminase [Gammaproteobacteria bacterium]MXW46158.1 histidinol-phosphate transaminase [Gammaproteobacteria bacterium]MYD01736.1 histidinol-phosphate transaminase [Gammaproteobacteria bacterium]MYI26413.1 histidinol-phosphate transaminase [Gammaproteobacteria bacterium]
MSWITSLAREAVQKGRAYKAPTTPTLARLHANELPWAPDYDPAPGKLNFYPLLFPAELTERMAEHYGVRSEEISVTRGSSEGIDCLYRAFCESGRDSAIFCPPSFEMFRWYGRLQGARVLEIPLRADDGFSLDAPAIKAAWSDDVKLLILCSPNNPTGNLMDPDDVLELVEYARERSVVVLDAAYAEFAGLNPGAEWIEAHPHVVVLRTVSKALGLAGVRCGAMIACEEIIGLMRRVQSPYSFSALCEHTVLEAMKPENLARMQGRIALVIDERERVSALLADLPQVRTVYPSRTNFVLLKVADADGFNAAARDGGYLLRRIPDEPGLESCVRITLGTPEQNDGLLATLRAAA